MTLWLLYAQERLHLSTHYVKNPKKPTSKSFDFPVFSRCLLHHILIQMSGWLPTFLEFVLYLSKKVRPILHSRRIGLKMGQNVWFFRGQAYGFKLTAMRVRFVVRNPDD